MEKLLLELSRLYLLAGALSADMLAQRARGEASGAISLLSGDGHGDGWSDGRGDDRGEDNTRDGLTRAIVLRFDKLPGSQEGQHWQRLCDVANALQTQLSLPAPAVSISGVSGYCLWLSLHSAVPATLVHRFIALLRRAYDPDAVAEDAPPLDDNIDRVELPPCLNQASGKWAAFINPGLGASFADESGLEMAPPLGGQAALLERLDSIAEAQFRRALKLLGESAGEVAPTAQPPVIAPLAAVAPLVAAQAVVAPMVAIRAAVAPQPRSAHANDAPAAVTSPAVAQQVSATTVPDGLLLRDATLEDIVRFLHAKNIEPTFRHMLPAHARPQNEQE